MNKLTNKEQHEQKLAVFIDADNLSPTTAEYMFDICNHFGTPVLKRAYGTSQSIINWTSECKKFAIKPEALYNCTARKNGADIALSIDAMETCIKRKVDTFVIASCDGDYLPLATKLRENGKTVISMGKAEFTSEIYRNGCDLFIALPHTTTK